MGNAATLARTQLLAPSTGVLDTLDTLALTDLLAMGTRTTRTTFARLARHFRFFHCTCEQDFLWVGVTFRVT